MEVPGISQLQHKESIQGSGLFDEPFSIRAVQFNDPQIPVLTSAPVEIFAEFQRIFRILGLGQRPSAAPVGTRHALVSAAVFTAIATGYEHGSGVALALSDDRRKPAGRCDRAMVRSLRDQIEELRVALTQREQDAVATVIAAIIYAVLEESVRDLGDSLVA